MTDFLEDKRREITSRLSELKPLVDEYRRLEAAAAALDGIPASTNGASAPAPRAPRGRRRRPGRPRGSKNASPPAASATRAATTTPAAKATTARRAARTRGARRKGSGKRGAQALALIQGQPGVAIPELATKMGIQQNYLYRVLPRLRAGRQGGEAGTRLASQAGRGRYGVSRGSGCAVAHIGPPPPRSSEPFGVGLDGALSAARLAAVMLPKWYSTTLRGGHLPCSQPACSRRRRTLPSRPAWLVA